MSSGLKIVLAQLFRSSALKMFNKMHPCCNNNLRDPRCNNNLSDPPGEPFPSVSISVAILHLHQLGEKGPVPNHLGNLVVIAVIVIVIIIFFLLLPCPQLPWQSDNFMFVPSDPRLYRDQSNSAITTYNDKQP